MWWRSCFCRGLDHWERYGRGNRENPLWKQTRANQVRQSVLDLGSPNVGTSWTELVESPGSTLAFDISHVIMSNATCDSMRNSHLLAYSWKQKLFSMPQGSLTWLMSLWLGPSSCFHLNTLIVNFLCLKTLDYLGRIIWVQNSSGYSKRPSYTAWNYT